MRKTLSILLVLLMVLGMCACSPDAQKGGTQDADDTTAGQSAICLAGFGESNITPSWSVPLSGFNNAKDRMSTGCYTYIYAYALAITDANGNTALLIAVDGSGTKAEWTDSIRLWCEETHGIPMENICVTTLHQHSTPISDEAYAKALLQWVKDAVNEAMEDRAPAKMYINTVETEALCFVRDYWTNDGTVWGPNHGDASSGLKSHVSDADNEMHLLKFERDGDKNDILMVNFRGHPHMGTSSTDTNVSADWPGIMREKVKETLGYDVIYFTGASGNLNSNSAIDSEMKTFTFREHGERAAEYVVAAEDSYTPVEMGLVESKELTITYKVDHAEDHLLEPAKQWHALAQQIGTRNANTAQHKANYPGLNSPMHANWVLTKAQLGEDMDVRISAISIGEIAFTVQPYEMFDSNGVELKYGTVGNEKYAAEDQMENPYTLTFVINYANGGNGYIPSQLGYEVGGYARDITYFAEGTGELLVTDYLKILNELYQ